MDICAQLALAQERRANHFAGPEGVHAALGTDFC